MVKTSGKVHQSPGQIRISRQPYIKDGWLWRSSGVDRTSEAVLEQNREFADRLTGNKIATECKGLKRPEFFVCLRREGKKAYGK